MAISIVGDSVPLGLIPFPAAASRGLWEIETSQRAFIPGPCNSCCLRVLYR